MERCLRHRFGSSITRKHGWRKPTSSSSIPLEPGSRRAAKDELNKKFWNYSGDIESVGEFIRLYLTRYGRWTSPLYLAGESYGTIRASGLAGLLVDKGIVCNGVILVSALLSYMTVASGNYGGLDIPYSVFLPSFAATAWYHKQLPEDLQSRSLQDLLAEVEEWALTGYLTALAKGDELAEDERREVTDATGALHRTVRRSRRWQPPPYPYPSFLQGTAAPPAVDRRAAR